MGPRNDREAYSHDTATIQLPRQDRTRMPPSWGYSLGLNKEKGHESERELRGNKGKQLRNGTWERLEAIQGEMT